MTEKLLMFMTPKTYQEIAGLEVELIPNIHMLNDGQIIAVRESKLKEDNEKFQLRPREDFYHVIEK